MRGWLLTALLGLLLTAPPILAVSVEDFSGRTVTLDRPAARIVALAPHIVENLFSAGAGGRVIGVVAYSDYPPAARQIEQVGAYNAISLEKIIALQPDLVVLWGSGGTLHLRGRLEQLGIPVYVSELRRLEDVPASIRRLARLAGTGAVGDREAARIETALDELQKRFAGKTPVPVFYEIWNEPLQTVGGDHLISQVITLCGGRNIFSDAVTLAPRVGLESVLQRDPAVIIASGMGESRPQWLDAWRDYPGMQAVRNEALFFIDPDHLQRPTARIVFGAERLCRILDRIRRR